MREGEHAHTSEEQVNRNKGEERLNAKYALQVANKIKLEVTKQYTEKNRTI